MRESKTIYTSVKIELQGRDNNIINHNLSLRRKKKKVFLKNPLLLGPGKWPNLFLEFQCCITRVYFNEAEHQVA